MEELFRFTMTEEDFRERIDALARCRGSRTRAAILWQHHTMWALSALIMAMLWLVGVLRGDALWIALAAIAVIMGLLRLFAVRRFVSGQMRALRRQKKKGEGLPQRLDREQRVFLRGGRYVHQIGQQVVDAIPLAALREARPGGRGGAVLLFETGMEDYLPQRLFGPETPVQGFCRRMNELAEAARQLPQESGAADDASASGAALGAGSETATGAGSEAATGADRPRPICTLRFALDGQQAVQLFAEGNVRLFSLPQRWKKYLRSLVPIALVLAVEWMFIGPVGALCIAMLPVAVLLGPALPPVSRAIYRRRLRTGRLDGILGEQRVEFYEHSVVMRRASGEYEQQYRLFLTLLETENAWFMVGQSAASMLPLPKESLPEPERAAFAAFITEKLAAASGQPG